MLVPTGTMNTPFGTAAMLELPHLEPLPGLLLLVALGNQCLTGVTSMLIGAAGLAPSGVVMTGVPEMGWPELPNTSMRLEMQCLFDNQSRQIC